MRYELWAYGNGDYRGYGVEVFGVIVLRAYEV